MKARSWAGEGASSSSWSPLLLLLLPPKKKTHLRPRRGGAGQPARREAPGARKELWRGLFCLLPFFPPEFLSFELKKKPRSCVDCFFSFFFRRLLLFLRLCSLFFSLSLSLWNQPRSKRIPSLQPLCSLQTGQSCTPLHRARWKLKRRVLRGGEGKRSQQQAKQKQQRLAGKRERRCLSLNASSRVISPLSLLARTFVGSSDAANGGVEGRRDHSASLCGSWFFVFCFFVFFSMENKEVGGKGFVPRRSFRVLDERCCSSFSPLLCFFSSPFRLLRLLREGERISTGERASTSPAWSFFKNTRREKKNSKKPNFWCPASLFLSLSRSLLLHREPRRAASACASSASCCARAATMAAATAALASAGRCCCLVVAPPPPRRLC